MEERGGAGVLVFSPHYLDSIHCVFFFLSVFAFVFFYISMALH